MPQTRLRDFRIQEMLRVLCAAYEHDLTIVCSPADIHDFISALGECADWRRGFPVRSDLPQPGEQK